MWTEVKALGMRFLPRASMWPLAALSLVALLGTASGTAHAQSAAQLAADGLERVEVADPFLELHSGPGRGYPVFHVATKGERVSILLRHTDWFQVRTDKGIEGWVARMQMQATLLATGAQPSFRDRLLDDDAARRFEFGGAFGRFKGEPMLKLHAAYRLGDAFRVEGTLGQVQGLYSGTDFWHLSLHSEPWAQQRLSPVLGIGLGRFRNLPNTSLVGTAPTDTHMALVSLGLRWQLSSRFLLRADYSLHTAYLDSRRTGEYRAVSGGVSFFF